MQRVKLLLLVQLRTEMFKTYNLTEQTYKVRLSLLRELKVLLKQVKILQPQQLIFKIRETIRMALEETMAVAVTNNLIKDQPLKLLQITPISQIQLHLKRQTSLWT